VEDLKKQETSLHNVDDVQDAPKITLLTISFAIETLVSRDFKLQLRQGADD
jgi:hypothetical protein